MTDPEQTADTRTGRALLNGVRAWARAVGVGVALSLLLQLNREAMDLNVVELIPRGDGRFEEQRRPRLCPVTR